MDEIVGLILAAGKGTRMGKQGEVLPKVMFEANGKPLVKYCVDNFRNAGIEKIVVVVGFMKEKVTEYLGTEVEYAQQKLQLGTGHAVMAARELLENQAQAVIICYGDMPLYKVETVRKLVELFETEKPTIAMLSVEFDNPEFWAYGRLVKDESGNVLKSVEQKDCDKDQLKIRECNPCFYIFDNKWLWENIDKLNSKNAQSEFYLTDLIGLARSQDKKVLAVKVSEESEALGVNTLEQLRHVEGILMERTNNGDL